jgi:uncharacterized OsmC-like protein
MANDQKENQAQVKTSKAHIKMIDHAASEIQIRDLALVISDEKPWNGGQNRGPSPLEYILAGLGA